MPSPARPLPWSLPPSLPHYHTHHRTTPRSHPPPPSSPPPSSSCLASAVFLFVENYHVKPDHKPQYDVEDEEFAVRRHQRERLVLAKDIVVGDILLNMHHGQLIPADCRILSCDPHLRVNNSLFGAGGDELRVSEDEGGHLGAEENPMDAENMCWRGTDITTQGFIKEALVVKVGKETQAGRTLKLLHAIEDKMDHQVTIER